MSSTFDEILGKLQGNLIDDKYYKDPRKDSNIENPIIIDKQRQFSIPKDYNPIIAYEGDVNTQIITFACKRKYEGYDLYQCKNKKLRWYNLSSGAEGNSNLQCSIVTENQDYDLLLRWDVPPEAMTKKGQLQFSISLFDVVNGRLAFSWNTSMCQALSVGETLSSVGSWATDYDSNAQSKDTSIYLPAKNEILTIDVESRRIVAPTGFNYTVCNYGDIGVSKICFQVKQYIGVLDVLKSDIEIKWQIGEIIGTESSLQNSSDLYAYQADQTGKSDLVNIVWNLPETLTKNESRNSGKFLIKISFKDSAKRLEWHSSTYKELTVGETDFNGNSEILPTDPEKVKESRYIFDGDTWQENKHLTNIKLGALVSYRNIPTTQNTKLMENELIAVRDGNNNFVGLKIGTSDNIGSLDAPYIAYGNSSSVTVIINGGNANGFQQEDNT